MTENLSEDKIKELTNQMRSQVAHATEVKEKKKAKEVEAHPEQALATKQEKITKDDETIKALKAKLKESEQQKAELQATIDKKKTAKKSKMAQDAMNAVMEGTSSVFEKDYSYPLQGDKTYDFHIKMHAPNILEIGKIANVTQQLVDQCFTEDELDSADDLPLVTQRIYEAIAYFKVVGDDVPDSFKEPEKMYKFDIVLDVIDDFNEWQATFLDSREI